MRHLPLNIELWRREGEAFELERGRYRAADERPITRRFRGLPVIFGHDDLRGFTSEQIRPEDVINGRSIIIRSHRQNDRGTRVVVPNLNRIDLVPMTAFA